MGIKIEGDSVIFSSGKKKYANHGIIGLSPKGDVTEGYDGGFFECAEGRNREPDLTPAECAELAEYMVSRWQEFGAKYKPHQYCWALYLLNKILKGGILP